MGRTQFGVTAAIALGSALLMSSATSAWAVPAPNEGPISGGTAITVEQPALQFTAIDASYSTSMGLTAEGDLYVWGETSDALGDGATGRSRIPIRVERPEGVAYTSFSHTSSRAFAIGTDGLTYGWGNNVSGQLGSGSTNSSQSPAPILLPDGVHFTSVSAGEQHTLAIGNDGNTYAWGDNDRGVLGDGTWNDSSVPVRVQQPDGVTFTKVSAGGQYSLALGDDGKLYHWGYLVPEVASTAIPAPLQTPEGVAFSTLSVGWTFAAALGDDGNVYTWGENDAGQLGNGTNTSSGLPVAVQSPADVRFTDADAGDFHGVAVGADGRLYAWGSNYRGRLGDGTDADTNVPVAVQQTSEIAFTQASAGHEHTLALTPHGIAYAWGNDFFGQLGGTGSNVLNSMPLPVRAGVETAAITFDGTPGTDLQSNTDGSISVVTPPHAAGPVDVQIEWTLNGVAQPPVVHAAGFTYVDSEEAAVPTVTNPEAQRVNIGGTAEFTVTATGAPTPSIEWEVSAEGGGTWESVPHAPRASENDAGSAQSTLSVLADDTNNGFRYRAVARNASGTATSQPAELTVVTEEIVPQEPAPTQDEPAKPAESTPSALADKQLSSVTQSQGESDAYGSLATTGATDEGMLPWIALLALLLGGGSLCRVSRGRRTPSLRTR